MSKLPSKKHSSDELSAIRTSVAVQQSPIDMAEVYNKKMVGKPLLILGYVFAVFAPFWLLILSLKGASSYGYTMTDLILMVSCIVVAILIALLIFIKRSLSRHHSSFIAIVALLSGFSAVYIVNKDSRLKSEVMQIFSAEVEQGEKQMSADEKAAQADFDRLMEKATRDAEKKSQP